MSRKRTSIRTIKPKLQDAATQTRSRDSVSDPGEAAIARRPTDPAPNAGSLGAFADDLSGLVLGLVLTRGEKAMTAEGSEIYKNLIEKTMPRDPLEQMLVEQMVWAHVRLQHLTYSAVMHSAPQLRLAQHEQANKTMNAYRRAMLAIRAYRSTPERSALVAVQQINESGSGDVVVLPGRRSATIKRQTN